MSKNLNLTAKDAAALEEFTQRVRTRLKDKLIGLTLFGSKSTGRDVENSDIDILVVVTEAGFSVEEAVFDIAFEVNLGHDVYISPRIIPRKILEDPVWKITPFLQHVTSEGIAL